MYIVTVNLNVKPRHYQEFMVKMVENATTSLTKEEGCHQFDVCRSTDESSQVFLYEVYASKAAFDLHLTSDHFLTFNQATSHWVLEKTVKTFQRV